MVKEVGVTETWMDADVGFGSNLEPDRAVLA
jgi:hypothetical protein